MEILKRSLRVLGLLLLGNYFLLCTYALRLPALGQTALLLALLAFYLWFSIRPRAARAPSRRLRTMIGGYEILLCSFWAIFLESILYTALYTSGALVRPTDSAPAWVPLLVNLIVFVPVIGLLLVNGFFRVVLTSARLRIVWRVMLLLFWWVPILHLFLFYHVLKSVRAEYYFALGRQELEHTHAENEDCRTRYPLVLIHGIFFRDWQWVNYWGRIPRALSRCGATIFYGRQQSAAPVARSAEELAAHISAIVENTGCEKVNLIAHSKGGLDSRYAITRLGLADKVASLTTINTPHRGCIFAQHLLDNLPKGVLRQMERKYNGLFRKLGDDSPDFMGGVRDLTSENCKAFNEQTPDMPGVLYQSVMSVMKAPRSAGFPLNLTWHLVNKYDREPNDGLVASSSAPWGDFLGELPAPQKRGISHGDIVDLMREDIPGFDVREFYTGIVKDLKAKGL
ncbi:triacylglycerol lipase [Agathobaculum sp. NTUH-O15-33]|uniref:esterase/lipase family protein n=1 Tax=Agathobaculum sp. NTUH-O15-33 TaxID=3079302 RepID=UPI0029585128|nr:alpha/beta fold hydrolase [Agathobaculum sp. NTUH-O15-33]WNX84870.1 triacylglycerol lipase [Agathobaculum sp. NTUH-O15-33]